MIRRFSSFMFTAAVIMAVVMTPSPASAQAGSLDPTFGTGGKVLSSVGLLPDAAALDASGNIIIAGTDAAGESGKIVRFLVNGKLDTSFGKGGPVLTSIPMFLNAVRVQADGKILVAGSTNGATASTEFLVARFNVNGTPDTTFGAGGLVVTPFPDASGEAEVVLEQPDGKILAGGLGKEGVLVRYNSNGRLDETFGIGGIVNVPRVVLEIALQSNGEILTSSGEGAQKVSSSGILASKAAVGSIIAVAQKGAGTFQNNGETVLGLGITIAKNRVEEAQVRRFLANGNADPRFNSPAFFFTGERVPGVDRSQLLAIALHSNGRIVVGGSSTTSGASAASSETVFGLARLDATGSLDSTFGKGGLVTTEFSNDDEIKVLLIQANGKIVAVGEATDLSTSTKSLALARYLSN